MHHYAGDHLILRQKCNNSINASLTFTADLMTCLSRKSTAVINNPNEGCIISQWFQSLVLSIIDNINVIIYTCGFAALSKCGKKRCNREKHWLVSSGKLFKLARIITDPG